MIQMSSPFPEQVAPGGILVYPQIQSPNYVPGTSGWAVFSDGNVEFNDGTFRGVVSGGSFDGTDFVINSLGLFFYSGTPAAGNLIASVAPAAGANDGEGNAFLAGFTVYDGAANVQVHVNSSYGAPAIELPTGVGSEEDHLAIYALASNVGDANEVISGIIVGPGSTYDNTQPGIILNSSAKNGSGNLASGELVLEDSPGSTKVIGLWDASGFFVTPADGNTYSTGQTFYIASSTTINSTTPIAITGLKFNVAATSYYVRGVIVGTAASSGTTQPGSFRFNGTATASAVDLQTNIVEAASGETVNKGLITAFNADPTVLAGAWSLSATYFCEFEGIMQFSAAGYVQAYGRVTTSGSDASWTVSGESWMIVQPI